MITKSHNIIICDHLAILLAPFVFHLARTLNTEPCADGRGLRDLARLARMGSHLARLARIVFDTIFFDILSNGLRPLPPDPLE